MMAGRKTVRPPFSQFYKWRMKLKPATGANKTQPERPNKTPFFSKSTFHTISLQSIWKGMLPSLTTTEQKLNRATAIKLELHRLSCKCLGPIINKTTDNSSEDKCRRNKRAIFHVSGPRLYLINYFPEPRPVVVIAKTYGPVRPLIKISRKLRFVYIKSGRIPRT